MKPRYRLVCRNGYFYAFDKELRKCESLQTKDRNQAFRLLCAKNEAHVQPELNLQLARTYLAGADPDAKTRSWDFVLQEIVKTKKGETKIRWQRAWKDKAFDLIRNVPLVTTRSHDFLQVLETGTVSTNVFLRRIHNFALDLNWLLAPVLPKKQWPPVRHGVKRAISWEEHLKTIKRETNPERRAFYELLWNLGGAQGDIANLHAEDVQWNEKVVSFERLKNRNRTTAPPIISFGSAAEHILESLPKSGPLFPSLIGMTAGHRATEFRRVCRRAAVSDDLTPHSYRYRLLSEGIAEDRKNEPVFAADPEGRLGPSEAISRH